MSKKIGKQTYKLENTISIIGNYATVGEKEGEGPFKKYFQNIEKDDLMGEKTFEKAERTMLEKTLNGAIKSAKLTPEKIDYMLGGDLLNQIVSTNYSARDLEIPLLGVYGACSTMSESLIIGSMLLDGGFGENVLCSAISHFSSAERQYRNPLEFGNQRQQYSQWTVTGSGATILTNKKIKNLPHITQVCIGKVVDFGVKDIANMGAAMAPAAMDTLLSFFKDTKTFPEEYDLIVSGDLGKLGSDILRDLMSHKKYKLENNYIDCGHSIYSDEQKALQGGSGAGCSASILNSYIIEKMKKNELKKVIFMATGALMNTTLNQQGDSIPSIAHLVVIEK